MDGDIRFTFIDLFAGIGGFRIAAQNVGGKCIFSSEIDTSAQKTYKLNFDDCPDGDITLEDTKNRIPKSFDCLFAGFPCQPFSIAGYRKGFEDTRGTLFYDIAKIVDERRPKALLLENVKNLEKHDGGKTLATIVQTLENLGYKVRYKVLNAMNYANVPQNRERIFIVCFEPKRVPAWEDFDFPCQRPLSRTIHSCVDPDADKDQRLLYTPDKMNA
ncbi:MAG: DNA (cytosine-5-)-methyltransferase [Thermoguttaceae bacterium]|nr:DNA (cytosine-5-)-methyltransferase [Thermoguttaceae bacterium]